MSGPSLFVPDIANRIKPIGFHDEVKCAAKGIAVRLGQYGCAEVERSVTGPQLESVIAADGETVAACFEFEIGQVFRGKVVITTWIQPGHVARNAVVIIPI